MFPLNKHTMPRFRIVFKIINGSIGTTDLLVSIQVLFMILPKKLDNGMSDPALIWVFAAGYLLLAIASPLLLIWSGFEVNYKNTNYK